MELLRFFTVSVAGVLVDVGLAWLLATALGAPLWLAAAVGFTVAAAMNYVLHRGWTFRRANIMAEHARLLRYLGALGLTFVARMAAVNVFGAVFGPEAQPLTVLLPSVAVSFAVGFLATKFLVFGGDEKAMRDE